MKLDEINTAVMRLAKQNKFEEAAEIYRKAVAEYPGDPALVNNLAGILNKCGAWDEVIEMCGRTIARYPYVTQLFNPLGQAHWCKHSYVEAIGAFQIASEMLPDFHMPKHNLGTLYLLHNKFEQGWWGHDYRFAAKGRGLRYKYENLWDGATPVPVLTVWGEQGVGDEILQLSMAGDLLASGLCGHIVWECDTRLKEIFSRSFPTIEFKSRLTISTRGHDLAFGPPEVLEQPAIHIPASSLGRIYRPNLEAFGTKDYLKANSPGIGMWDPSKKRVGISWHSERAQYAQWKSSPLSAWAPLLSLPGIDFINLQYGNSKDLAAFPQVANNRNLDRSNNLSGLADLIATCDLVVTVSNTTAHIAAAMGVPTIVLITNTAITPWYWGVTERTPWYPGAKVMRRAPGESWEGLLDRVTLEVGSQQ